jgi:resuscitation-promoting factor RpfA
MTKVGKTIIAVLVAVDLAFVFYIISPQGEHSRSKSDESAEASAKGAALEAGVIANASGGGQVTSGAIAGDAAGNAAGSTAGNTSDSAAPPSTSDAGRIATASAPPPKPVAVPNVLLQHPATPAMGNAMTNATAPTVAAAPTSNAKEPRVAVRQQPVKTVDVTNARMPADPKATIASRSNRAADDAHSNGSNAVSAAMTEALVRQSAQLDPNLPPPDMSKSVSTRDGSDPSPHGGANPVAAAMTEQLVRESTRFNPPAHLATGQTGTQ